MVDDRGAVELGGIHICPRDLFTVEVGDEAIVVINREDHLLCQGRGCQLEAVPYEDALVVFLHVVEHRRIVPVSIAEARGAGVPLPVVEVEPVPIFGRGLGPFEEAEFRPAIDERYPVFPGSFDRGDLYRVGFSGRSPDDIRCRPGPGVGFFVIRGATLKRGSQAIGRLRPGVRFSVVGEGDHVAAGCPELEQLSGIVEIAGKVSFERCSLEAIAVRKQVGIPGDHQVVVRGDGRFRRKNIGYRPSKQPPSNVDRAFAVIIELDEFP